MQIVAHAFRLGRHVAQVLADPTWMVPSQRRTLVSVGPLSNGLRFTRAASLDRDERRDTPSRQNGDDLVAAQRRRVEARVGPPLGSAEKW